MEVEVFLIDNHFKGARVNKEKFGDCIALKIRLIRGLFWASMGN
jgi:hypothetical protein